MNKNMDLLNLLLDRRSCRTFRPEPLDRPTLAAIVEAGRYAPSAMNVQLCRFYVITDPRLLRRISDTVSRRLEGFADRDCRYGAPALVLVTNRTSNPCALQDAACAMENMMLAACAVGVGSCWINQPYHLREDAEMRSLLSELGALPDEFPCCSLALGLPEGPLFPGRREHTGNQVTWLVGEEKNS